MRIKIVACLITVFYLIVSYLPISLIPSQSLKDNSDQDCLAPKSKHYLFENLSLQMKLMDDFVSDFKTKEYDLGNHLGLMLEETLGKELLELSEEKKLISNLKTKNNYIVLSWNKPKQTSVKIDNTSEISFKEYRVGLTFSRKSLARLLNQLQNKNPELLQKLLAEKIYNDLPADPTGEEIKEAFANIETIYPDGGTEAFLYDYHYKKTRMDLVEANDIVEAGELGATKILQKMQNWMETKGKNRDEKFVWMMATGKTPDIMLNFLYEIWSNWDSAWAKDFLKKHGITQKLPMERLIITHLDTTFPQQRSYYHAFPSYINQWAKKFGVPETQRKLWYADFTIDEKDPEKIRKMNDFEFKSLMKDIDARGLLVQKYIDNELPENDPQYAFFKAMQMQCANMSNFLKEYGGPDLVIGSCGPSYDGFGHVGFVESGYGKIPSAFMGLANYHNAGAQGMLNGGYSNMLDSKGDIKYGYATFAIPEMTIKEDAEMLMLINGNNSKEQSVRYAIEGDYQKDFPKAPVVGLSKSKGSWIVDPSTNTQLRKNYYPWDMKILDENFWTQQNVIKLFIRVVKDVQKRKPNINISNLTVADFLNSGFDEDKVPPMIRWIRNQNIKNLFNSMSWEECQNIVKDKLSENLKNSDEVDTVLWGKAYVEEFESILKKRNQLQNEIKNTLNDDNKYLLDDLVAIDEGWINKDKEAVTRKLKKALDNSSILKLFLNTQAEYIEKRKTIFMPDPHPDDRYLAIQSVVEVLIKKGHRVITKTLTPGSSAVSNELVGKFVSEWSKWDQIEIDKAIALDREQASIQLLKLAKQNRLKNKEEALDFAHWDKLSSTEQTLRAQILFNYLFHKYCEGEGLNTAKQIENFKNLIFESFEKKNPWGSKNFTVVDKIKTFIRVIEEKSAMLSWGVPYRNIYDPSSFAWYSAVGKNGAARPEDIDYFVDLFESLKRVDLVFGNDENFIDFGAHSITKSIVLGALKKLKEKGYFSKNPSFRFMGYAGVWDGILTEEADLTVLYNEQEKKKFFKEFWQIYLSQVPAEGCDPSMDELNTFADAVIERGEKTKQEYLALLSSVYKKFQQVKGCAYALSFTVKDIFKPDFDEKLKSENEMLNNVGKKLETISTEKLYGTIKGPKILNDFSSDELFRLYQRVKGMGRKATKDFFNDLIKSGYVGEDVIEKMYVDILDGIKNKKVLTLVQTAA
ncbi:hypothetical protein ACFLQ1_00460 [Candidatus Auribacterota bacterium]